MDDHKHTRAYHALLIGIDCYVEKPLEGAVRDARAIDAYLKKRRDAVQVRLLTATPQDVPGSTTPNEDPNMWPTCENVISALSDIAAKALPGDCVYIHFSGHGTRMTATSLFRNEATGELALNLLAGDGRGIQYLPGEKFASALKSIGEKGAILTAVLDCCFSGSVLRRDDDHVTVRELPYDPAIDQEYPSDFTRYAAPMASSRSSDLRDGSAVPNWLINPDGYTILTACGPGELAHEDVLDGREKHGILSFFLLQSLALWEGTPAPQLDIYRRICAMFKERCPRQNPMLFGNRTLSFFADHRSPVHDPDTFVASARGAAADIQVQVGRAHGVTEGDLFSLFPTHPTTGTGIASEVSARVKVVGGLTSTLELLEAVTDDNVRSIQTGWGAKALTRHLLRKFPVRLSPDLPCFAGISASLQLFGSLNTHAPHLDTEHYSFLVKLGTDGTYIIFEGGNHQLPNIPVISATTEDGIPHLMDVLEHLTKFKLVRELTEDSNGSFRQSFAVQLLTQSGECKPDEMAHVTTGDVLVLKVENRGIRTLYVHIFDLGPQFHVQNIKVRDDFEVLPPRNPPEGYPGTLRKKLQMKLPRNLEEAGHDVCEDVFKVFVTARPTSFSSLELPRLGDCVPEPKRLARSRISSGEVEDDLTEDWAALAFTIRTSAKPKSAAATGEGNLGNSS